MTKKTGLEAPYILAGSSENFAALELENSTLGPVWVNYWSPKAGPCLRLYPILDKLIHEFAGKMLLIKVNVDEHNSHAQDYGVNSLPTLKLFHNRAVAETLHGYQPESELRNALARYLPRSSDPAIQEAIQVYQKGNKQRALALLADAAIEDAQNLRIPTTLAKLLMRDHRHSEAYRLLAALPGPQRKQPEIRDLLVHLGFLLMARDAPDEEIVKRKVANEPRDLVARHQLCALRLLKDHYEQAMELLLEIMQINDQYADGVGRKGLLSLFNIPGVDRALVSQYRKKTHEYSH